MFLFTHLLNTKVSSLALAFTLKLQPYHGPRALSPLPAGFSLSHSSCRSCSWHHEAGFYGFYRPLNYRSASSQHSIYHISVSVRRDYGTAGRNDGLNSNYQRANVLCHDISAFQIFYYISKKFQKNISLGSENCQQNMQKDNKNYIKCIMFYYIVFQNINSPLANGLKPINAPVHKWNE